MDNILAFVTRDFKQALDFFYPTEALPDFVERSIGTEIGLEFPIFVIGPRENAVETTDDESHLIEPQRIDIKIGVIDESAAKVYQKCMKYVRVLDSVLRSASQGDYFVGMTDAFDLHVEVTHSYGPLGNNDSRTTYFKPASLELSVSLRELA